MREPHVCREAFVITIALLLGAAAQAQVIKIDLGDIVAGGDGAGTAPPDIIGINPDSGLLESFFTDAPIGIGDGAALQAVEDATSELIDSVFIVELEEMPINSAGVTFQFPPEDLLAPPATWGQILKERIGGEYVTLISIDGLAFEHGLGIHAAAGITFDLDVLRAIHGEEAVGQVSTYAGMGDTSFDPGATAGFVTTYLILSDENGILGSVSHRASTDDFEERGKLLRLLIPPGARFLTLASGAGNGQFYFNSGAFGDAIVTPTGFCPVPPALATRDLKTFRTPEETNGDFLPGDLIDVEITLSDIRAADPGCNAPAGLVLKEMPPAGWAPSQISEGGSHDPGTNTISWTLSGPALTEGKKLTYKVTAAATSEIQVTFGGSIAENLPAAEEHRIRGESRLLSEIPFDACGGIRSWNILGAFLQPFGDNPGDDNLRLDYMTDGRVNETQFVFFPGAQVATAFGGDGLSTAASTGITGGANDRSPGGIPTVLAWNDTDGLINLNDDVFGGDPDGVMAYAQAYVENTTGGPLSVNLGISSDDSVQVLLNGEEVWFHSVGRAGADACTPQDFSPDGLNFTSPHVLSPGTNSLIVKVWDGAVDWNFAIRFQDAGGTPITDGLSVRKFPEGICTAPALSASRSITPEESVLIQCSEERKWNEGATYDVSIAVADIRRASGTCAAPASVTIEERIPDGWTAGNVSSPGAVNGSVISWLLSGASLAPGTLTYQAKAVGPFGDARFGGRIAEAGSGIAFVVGGVNLLSNPAELSDQGFIRDWLLLGPYRQQIGFGWGAAPSIANMTMDFLTDGAGINEIDVEPEAGDTVNTAFSGASPSPGLAPAPTAGACGDVQVPTWKEWRDRDDTINFNDFYGGDLNQIMMYAVAYVCVDADVVADIGLGSDDAVQVLLDGVEVHINSIARPPGVADEVQDTILAVNTPSLNPLTAGAHKLMVKVFEGGGGHAFRLRFQDPTTAMGITEGISILLDPGAGCGIPPRITFVRGDVNADGIINITDPISLLAFLFQGGTAPSCRDAADADNSFGTNITDPIYILSYLFQGGPPPLPPTPSAARYAAEDCGEDPAEPPDELECAGFPPCPRG